MSKCLTCGKAIDAKYTHCYQHKANDNTGCPSCREARRQAAAEVTRGLPRSYASGALTVLDGVIADWHRKGHPQDPAYGTVGLKRVFR